MTQQLKAVDRIEVIALMDNVSDPFTSCNKHVRLNEFEVLFGKQHRETLSGKDMCRACSGLSLLIKLFVGEKQYNVLFDTGPDDGLVVENAKRLRESLSAVDAIVISHGHFDHYGGVVSVLDAMNRKNVPVHIHPELFAPRAFELGKRVVETDYILAEHDIVAHGGEVIANKDMQFLFDEHLLISGEVPRKTTYEKGLANELRKIDGEWEHAHRMLDAQFARFHRMSNDEIKSAILNDSPERESLECFIHVEGSAVLYQWLEARYTTSKEKSRGSERRSCKA